MKTIPAYAIVAREAPVKQNAAIKPVVSSGDVKLRSVVAMVLMRTASCSQF